LTKPNDTIRVLIPLKVRKRNGRPKILPPVDYLPSEDQTQGPHVLRAIGRAWGWRRRMEAGEFATIQELAEAVGLAERHVSRQLRLNSGPQETFVGPLNAAKQLSHSCRSWQSWRFPLAGHGISGQRPTSPDARRSCRVHSHPIRIRPGQTAQIGRQAGVGRRRAPRHRSMISAISR
jgi:hypothetical protein